MASSFCTLLGSERAARPRGDGRVWFSTMLAALFPVTFASVSPAGVYAAVRACGGEFREGTACPRADPGSRRGLSEEEKGCPPPPGGLEGGGAHGHLDELLCHSRRCPPESISVSAGVEGHYDPTLSIDHAISSPSFP
jgi:hypothetical protein